MTQATQIKVQGGTIIGQKEIVSINEKTQVVPQQSNSMALFNLIETLAQKPDVDLDRVEKLIAMRDKEMERIAQNAFNSAMAQAQSEMPSVLKNSQNSYTSSKYANYEAISTAIQPIIAKYGFSLSFGEGKSDRENHIKIFCDVAHVDGYEKHYEANIPLDDGGVNGKSNKNPTQAFGSTITYARRYIKAMIFDVSVSDDDNDGNSRNQLKIINKEQLTILLNLISETDSDARKFSEVYGINSLNELPAHLFGAARNMLLARKAKIPTQNMEQANATHN